MLTTTLTKDYTDKLHEHVPCPLCNANNDYVLATRGYPGIPVRNVICKGCGLIRINPRMTQEGYESFYREDFFEYLNPYSRPAYVQEIEHTRDEEYNTPLKQNRLPFIRQYVPHGGRVLDVGAGFGQILYLLEKEKNVTYVGIEPDPYSREVAREKIGVILTDTTVEAFLASAPGTFDFIYMDQVFEHLLSPLETLTELGKLLSPEGVMYIGVPGAYNPQIPMQIFYQLAHTYNYTPHTMNLFAERAGLKIIALPDPEGYPLEVLLARKDSRYPSEQASKMRAGFDWKDVVRRLKRKARINVIRGFGKGVVTAVCGVGTKERLKSILDKAFGYRY